MIDIEVIVLNSQQKPSDEGVPLNRLDWPAGETVRSLLDRVDNVDRFVYSLAPIGEEDVDFEGAAVTLDDVVARSSRLFVRPRVDGADSAVVFLYAADGNPGTPVGAVDLKQIGIEATLGAYKCYDFVMTNAKENLDNPGITEGAKAAALQLLNSKPSRKDLEFLVLSEYSPTSPTDATFLDEIAQSNRRYWVRVDASSTVSEIIEPLRGRRACHIVYVRPARSAGPTPPRGASEELPAKPKGKKGSFIFFAEEQRPKLKKKGMSAREIARPRRHRIEAFCSRAEPPVSPQARKCSDLWSELTPEAKQKYQALADEDEVRYEKEMDLWRAQCTQKVAGDSRAAKPPPLSIETVNSAIHAVWTSDAALRAAAVDGTLTGRSLRMAVAAHLKEADGGARLKSEYEALFAAAEKSLIAAYQHLAHQPPPEPGDSGAANSSPLSYEIVASAIEAVVASDASLKDAMKKRTLKQKMLLTAVAAHLKEADGGARLKSGFGALFAAAAPALREPDEPAVVASRAHQAPPEPDEPAAEPPPAPELLTGAAGLLQILDEFRIKNGGVDDPYYAAMRSALEELEIEERGEGRGALEELEIEERKEGS